MTIIREFLSNFTKIKRTPIVLLHLLLPVVLTTLFFVYCDFAGYRIISDVRWFFILLQIGYPIFVSIVVPVFVHLDRNINEIQNALGLVASRKGVYLGKLFFLLFFSAMSMVLYELCFYIGTNLFLGISITQLGFYFSIFYICLFSSLFLYLFHIWIAFRFGSSISVLIGIAGTIFAGYFENAIGDKIWIVIPWEWGIRFLKSYFGLSGTPICYGIVFFVVMNSIVLILSILWFSRWEGKVTQE